MCMVKYLECVLVPPLATNYIFTLYYSMYYSILCYTMFKTFQTSTTLAQLVPVCVCVCVGELPFLSHPPFPSPVPFRLYPHEPMVFTIHSSGARPTLRLGAERLRDRWRLHPRSQRRSTALRPGEHPQSKVSAV